MNPLGIQILKDSIAKFIFPKNKSPSLDKITLAKKHLQSFDLLHKNLEPLAQLNGLERLLDFIMPKRQGHCLGMKDFFRILGKEQSSHPRNTVWDFAQSKIPEIPKEFLLKSGWTRYDGNYALSVQFPLEDALVFDTEVLYKVSQFPLMATAVSKKAWYVWLSPELFSDKALQTSDKLISLGNSKIIIGHHVAYDRVRVKEEYSYKESHLSFLDTMSLHVTIGGLSSQQRGSWLKYKKGFLFILIIRKRKRRKRKSRQRK